MAYSPAFILPWDSQMTRILIGDDHDVVRAGLRAILQSEAGWEVVAEAIVEQRPEGAPNLHLSPPSAQS